MGQGGRLRRYLGNGQFTSTGISIRKQRRQHYNKSAVLSSAKKNVRSVDRAAAVTKWWAAHPHLISVQITGDTALLTFILDRSGASKAIMSCDMFEYQGGRWRALYSQHIEAGK
jgi:hypothetical protein